MNWNKHFEIKEEHAFLSPSKWVWVNYNQNQQVIDSYNSYQSAEEGTKLHALAADLIKRGIKLADEPKTLNMYVNNSIDLGLDPEVKLVYSKYCHGRADAIGFKIGLPGTRPLLIIHDYKSGVSKTHIEQLMIYAALFCLEYMYKPEDIDIVLRIYQNNMIEEDIPISQDIQYIIDKIIWENSIVEDYLEEAE